MSKNKNVANPFPGLRPFEAYEHHLFFGRENQIGELRRKLKRTHFLAIVGTSGGGKSSLIRAGFLPTLTNNNEDPRTMWRIAIMRPGNDPIGNLANALNSKEFWAEDERPAGHGQFTETALRHGSLGLIDTIREFRISENILIVVDQFEELFRFIDTSKENAKDDASKFVKLLLESFSQRDIPIYVSLTMRSDYLGDCPHFRDLPEAINDSQYLIPRLTRNQLRSAIRKPIKVSGGKISTRLLSKILNNIVDSQDQLPILQHALMRTYDAWKNDPGEPDEIDLDHYNKIGGMQEALSQHAEEIYDVLSDKNKIYAASLFKSLTAIDFDARIVRRPCSLGEVSVVANASEGEMKEVVDTFRAPGRSFIMPPYGETLSGKTVLDISHESLMRGWKSLKKWIREEQESAKTYLRLAESAALHDKKQTDLLRNPMLGISLEWKKKQDPTPDWSKRYNPNLGSSLFSVNDLKNPTRFSVKLKNEGDPPSKYLKDKLSPDTQKLLDEYGGPSPPSESLLAALVKELNKLLQGNLLYDKQQFPQVILGEKIRRLIDQNPQGSGLIRLNRLLLEEAYPHEIAKSPDFDLCVNYLDKSRRWNIFRKIGYAGIITLVIAAIGVFIQKQILEEEKDKLVLQIKKTDLSKKESGLLSKFNSKEEQDFIVNKLASSEGSNEEHYKVRRSFELAANARANAQKDPAIAIRIAQKAQEIDNNVITNRVLYETISPLPAIPRASFVGHTRAIWSVSFSPDGQFILTGSEDNTAKLWDLNGKEIRTFKGHTHLLNSAFFSPDMKFILTCSRDNTAKLWDINGNKIQDFIGHTRAIWSVSFSPDGQFILTGSEDNTAKLWDLNGKEIRTFKGHVDDVLSVAFSPGGQSILTGSFDKTAKLWDLNGKEIRTYKGHREAIWEVAFSPDGQSILTGSSDNTVKLWDLNGSEIQSFKAHKGSTYGVAFSPVDSKLILSGGGDNTARLWDIEKINLDREVLLSEDVILPLTFSEKLKYDTIEIDEVLAAKEELDLIFGADYFRQKYLNEKRIYLRNEYFSKAKAVYKHILENKNTTFDDSSLAGIYSVFGMLQLLNRDFEGAIALAENGLKLEKKPPVKNFSVSALGYLLDGQFKEAEKRYLEWKEKNGRYPQSFLEDLSILKRSGIRNSDIEKIETMLKAN